MTWDVPKQTRERPFACGARTNAQLLRGGPLGTAPRSLSRKLYFQIQKRAPAFSKRRRERRISPPVSFKNEEFPEKRGRSSVLGSEGRPCFVRLVICLAVFCAAYDLLRRFSPVLAGQSAKNPLRRRFLFVVGTAVKIGGKGLEIVRLADAVKRGRV